MTTTVFEHLSGLIERVTFHNTETGFAVMQVKVRGMHDLVPVLGTLPEVTAGEWIDAHGKWFIDQQYGRQFRSVERPHRRLIDQDDMPPHPLGKRSMSW